MNQAEFLRRARKVERDRRSPDAFDRIVSSRTPEQRARVEAIYRRFCEQHAAARRREVPAAQAEADHAG